MSEGSVEAQKGLEKYRLEGERTAGSVLRALAAEILFFAITCLR